MRKIVLLALLVPLLGRGQMNLKTAKKKTANIFQKSQPRPQVMLLGVFHFAGEKVDANTTPDALRVDMLLPERQKQIRQLLASLAAFKPNKIAIESDPGYEHVYDSFTRITCRANLLQENIRNRMARSFR